MRNKLETILILLTCYNRKDKTLKCIHSIYSKSYNVKFIILDDNSTDGTFESIKKLEYDIVLLRGNGSSYWNGGMRLAVSYIFENKIIADYILFINDDVDFHRHVIDKMVQQSKKKEDAVIVGATCDNNGNQTYGAIKYKLKGIKYETVGIDQTELQCDTFNCNCVLINKEILNNIGNFDELYTHAFGDFDYGLRIKKAGYSIYTLGEFVGICNTNSVKDTWKDNTISIFKRLKLKESIKGLPRKQWFYFLKTHFDIKTAIWYTITSYLRIFIKR